MSMTAYEAFVKALGAAINYVNKTIAGTGAIKGKNCTIDSIVQIEGGHRITFKWTEDNGTVETETMDVMDGEDDIFFGTEEEWDALTEEEQNQYNFIFTTDDEETFCISIPEGGTAGQVLVKKSSEDYDAEWSDVTQIIKHGVTTYDIYVPQNISDNYHEIGNVLNISTDAFLSTFYDIYIGTNADDYTVTKKSIGADESGAYQQYEYDFCPKNWDRMFLISSGIHSYECTGVFGLAYFIKSVMENHADNAMLDYIYNHVRIKVVPILNPWGWNQNPKIYANVNGVNPNRNYDYNHIWEEFPIYSPNPNDANYDEWNYKGEKPFSESETRNIRKWILNNLGAEFYIDCHNSHGDTRYECWTQTLSDSIYADKISNAQAKAVQWAKDYYGITNVNTNFLLDSPTAIRTVWCEKFANIPQLVIEQSDGNSHWCTNNIYNDSRAILNYAVQIFIYVSEFLARETTEIQLNDYLLLATQQTISCNKMLDIYNNENVLIRNFEIEVGSIKYDTGAEITSTTGVRTIGYIPIEDDDTITLSCSNKNLRISLRFYDEDMNYVVVNVGDLDASGYGYKIAFNDRFHNSCIVGNNIIVKQNLSQRTFKYLRIVLLTLDGSDITESDYEGIQFNLNDGVTERKYKFVSH